MSRESAWRGTWTPNRRPYIRVAPDVYVRLQAETTIIGCGECRRKVNFNDYVTSVSTEASVDSPPGSATIQLSIPDNDVNDFYAEGQLLIQPMMEVEVFAKGYYLIGGVPQYYRIFWGIVSSVSKSWSNGTTSVNVSCKDILRWWELTNTTINPAFLEGGGSSAGHYQLFQNQFSGQNPYATIVQLAQDAMGDFFYTTDSFTSYRPEKGPEAAAIGSFMKDIMAYWQLKFGNIQSNLVLYGMSGQAYSFSGVQGTVSPNQVAEKIFQEEVKRLRQNQSTTLLFSSPKEQATAKTDAARAGDVEFFQNETQSKLALAFHARDQIGYEFYCDTTGDIVFKPPFYNLNVLPNKPVSWIQDFDIIDDQLTDSEAEVVTHVTSSGNAFGGVTDWGLNDEITTPRTGVFDYHLLRRYGWRRADLQLEWAGNPRKLFFHLLDWMDRLNAKRQNGTITMPMRPELRMGFPVWVPRHDSFFYVQGISHQHTVGGQSTTSVTLTAKRSKFIAPKNIGTITRAIGKDGHGVTRDVTGDEKRDLKGKDPVYNVDFPGQMGSTSGLGQEMSSGGTPAIIRDPKTGKLLGFPNVVMVYKSTYSGTDLQRIMETMGRDSKPAQPKPKTGPTGPIYREIVHKTLLEAQANNKQALLARLRAHRYEAGMTNAGAYDYAHDKERNFREFALVPLNSYNTNVGTGQENEVAVSIKSTESVSGAQLTAAQKEAAEAKKKLVGGAEGDLKAAQKLFDEASRNLKVLQNRLLAEKKKVGKNVPADGKGDAQLEALGSRVKALTGELATLGDAVRLAQERLGSIKASNPSTTYIPALNVMVRPVSDEFGFEVIGHYRYGRGAYIDRGKLQIQSIDDDFAKRTVNQLSIQFAPTGGFLTDGSNSSNLNGAASGFSSAFEQMRPEDYVTGASFTASIVPNGQVSNVQTTSSGTYTTLINADKGTGLYVEADATRRAKTLGEMTPTLDTGIADPFRNCACGLGKTSWFSLLPSELIQSILSPARSELSKVGEEMRDIGASEVAAAIGGGRLAVNQTIVGGTKITVNQKTVTKTGRLEPANASVILTQSVFDTPHAILTSEGFFEGLNKFLLEKFQKEVRSNEAREASYTLGGSVSVFTPPGLRDGTQDNILSDPKDPLFRRASMGDKDALDALRKQANFNFGLTKEALSNFKDASSAALDKAGNVPADLREGFRGVPSPVTASTGPGKGYQPPAPNVGDPINQRRYDNAGFPQNVPRDGTPV